MMNEEYTIMTIRGLPMILICEIMTTIKKKIRNVHNGQCRVKLGEEAHCQQFRST